MRVISALITHIWICMKKKLKNRRWRTRHFNKPKQRLKLKMNQKNLHFSSGMTSWQRQDKDWRVPKRLKIGKQKSLKLTRNYLKNLKLVLKMSASKTMKKFANFSKSPKNRVWSTIWMTRFSICYTKTCKIDKLTFTRFWTKNSISWTTKVQDAQCIVLMTRQSLYQK